MPFISKRMRVLIAFIIILGGLNIAILFTKVPKIVGILMVIIGCVVLWSVFRKVKITIPKERSISLSLIDKLPLNRRIFWSFPFIGIALIILDVIFNLYYLKSSQFGSHDLVVILLGITFIAYNYIPKRFWKERDFAFLFLLILFIILIIPVTVYNLSTGGLSEKAEPSNRGVVHYLLAIPVSFLVNLFGIESNAEGDIVHYQMVNGDWEFVGISLGCSGIYSFTVFVSGFASFVFVEYQRLDRKVGILLALGVLTAYLANLLRMSIIIVVGSYYGLKALIWTHANLGEIIFLIWISVFWFFMFKYLIEDKKDLSNDSLQSETKV